MTDSADLPPPLEPQPVHEWDQAFAALRDKYPQATQGILFCIHKLQQDPDLKIPDFRAEAALHGIKLGGRALHSARVLLGLEEPGPPRARRRSRAAEDVEDVEDDERSFDSYFEPQDSGRRRTAAAAAAGSLESQLVETIQRIQSEATDEARRLRTAIEEAIRVLQTALRL